jgi:16S rRNA (adenine1518-N6/adenine1519-N6)-dimethyltransferase
MRFKKSLGQHFLRSERALSSIIGAGDLKPGDVVLEIGPGEGVLTEKILQTGARVIAIEKDDGLYEFLTEKFKNENIELIHGDILNLETSNLQTYKLISNIPYNITGAILRKFLSAENQPELMVLLVQKEVAERIVGGPHSAKASRGKKESILSISVKAYGRPKYIETVKAGSFAPAPKVDSAIIAIEDISKNFFNRGSKASTVSEELFFKLVRAGFKSKRKKLISNLNQICSKKELKEAWNKLNLDENVRAEDLSLENWGELAKNLEIL